MVLDEKVDPKMEKKINITKFARCLFWFLALFCYNFQCPIPSLAKFIIPTLFIFIVLELRNYRWKRYGFTPVFLVYIAYLCTFLIYSVLKGNILTWAIRFFLILLVIPVCFVIKDMDFEAEEKIFIYISIAKCIMLILLAVAVICMRNVAPFSAWASSNGFGSIYVDDGYLKVQLHGNSLLVVAFMVSYMRKRRINWQNVILLVGVFIAGNFAFVLGVVCFVAYRALRIMLTARGTNRLMKFVIAVVAVAGMMVMIPFVANQIKLKSSYSNAVRVEQAEVLLDTNVLIGEGLGHKVVAKDESMRFAERLNNYSYYFELQTLYIFHQIGFVGMFLFYLITIWAAYKNGRECLWLYLIYLFYSFWNPYCFDTTQMIAIIAIMNLRQIQKAQDETAWHCYMVRGLKAQ